MKETKKIIPFLVAAILASALFYFNPDQDAHGAKIKAEYTEANPKTWRLSWWTYERSLSYHDYLFLSVVKRKHRPRSIGVAGMVVTLADE